MGVNALKWPLISAEEAVERLKRGAVGLDVRSSGEYLTGALAGFRNIPILNNEHRHMVGLAYKHEGQEKAIELGMRLVEPLRPQLIEEWRAALTSAEAPQRILICWRGGLRSEISANWLSEAGVSGVRVNGGYKAIRLTLLRELQEPPPLLVIGGMTGAGKTPFLHRFLPEQVIDLESLASHRGSAFGALLTQKQPSQQEFENSLAFLLWGSAGQTRLVESESRMIGAVCVPETLMNAMDQAPMVVLEDSLENRTRRIFEEYVLTSLASSEREAVREHYIQALNNISRRLGGLRARQIGELLNRAFYRSTADYETHSQWIESLLREYYDPAYVRSLNVEKRNVLFRGDADACEAFLTNYLDRRRPQPRSISK